MLGDGFPFVDGFPFGIAQKGESGERVAQVLRPKADIASPGSWIPTPGPAKYSAINEVVLDPATFVQDFSGGSGGYMEVLLDSGVYPGTGASVVMRCYAKATFGGSPPDLKFDLYCGATLIASKTQVLTVSTALYVLSLTPTQRGAISDWVDLRFRFELAFHSFGTGRIEQAFLEAN